MLDIPDDDMPEYNPGGDDFGGGDDDDDLGGADAIQALSKAEKILDKKVKIEVLHLEEISLEELFDQELLNGCS